MGNRIIRFIVLLVILNANPIHSQDRNDFNSFIPPAALTPEAAMLHSFIDVPVGFFTGTADLSIPLGEIKTARLSIPVSLRYSSLGLKVDQIASSVGSGWSLQAGGMISQNIRGYYDFINGKGYTKIGVDKLPIPFYGFVRLTDNQLLQISGAYNVPEEPHYDTEPDIYYYSYPGGAGKFVYDRSGTINLIPKKPIKIISPSGGGYKIIDENGIVYKYQSGGGSTSEYEPQSPHPWDVRILPHKNTQFYLIGIDSPDGVSITFEYESEASDYSFSMLTRYKKIDMFCGPATFNPSSGTVYVHSVERRLKRIFTNTGKRVDFVYNNLRLDAPAQFGSPELKELNQVIWFFNSDTIRKINLEYGYFDSRDQGNVSYKNKRLSLLKVYEQGKPGYEFTYFNSNLTSKLNSFSQDIYGYNNGASNASLVPAFEKEAGGANRNENITYLKAGTLSRIKYPTGGRSDFDYELNTGGTDNHYIGGLRVKSIVEYDSDNSILKSRYFEYNKPGTNQSSGIENSTPVFVQELTRWTYTSSSGDDPCAVCSYQVYEAKSHTSSNVNGVSGGNGFYQFVTESVGLDGTAGKTLYEYTVFKDRGNSGIRPGTPETDYSWARGQMLSVAKLQFSNGSFYLASKDIYTYHWEHDFSPSSDSPVRINENFIGGCKVDVYYPQCVKDYSGHGIPSIRDASLRQSGYYHISAWFYLKSKEERTYKPMTDFSMADNADYYVSNKQVYEYSSAHLLVKNIIQSASNKDTIVVSYKYPGDYIAGTVTPDPIVSAIKKMQDDHIISSPIETIKSINSKVISGSLTIYGINEYSHVVPFESKQMELEIPVDSLNVSLSSINQSNNFLFDNRYAPDILFNSYDVYSNLLSFQKANNYTTSFIWGYNNNYPVAKIENASLQEVQTAFGGSIPDLGKEGLSYAQARTLKSELPGSMLSTFSYSPMVGMTSQTDPNEITTYYEYDLFGRLKAIKDHDGNILKTYEYHYGQ